MTEGARIISEAIKAAVAECDKFEELGDITAEELVDAAQADRMHATKSVADADATKFYEAFGIAIAHAIQQRRIGATRLRVEDAIPGEWATRTKGDA